MKTYAEKKGRKPFDWNEALDEVIKNPIVPLGSRHKKLMDLAGLWVTCACGNQCSVIPRDVTGEPIDKKLRELGCEFSVLIDERDWKSAKKVLKKIERRSAKLIDEIRKELE